MSERFPKKRIIGIMGKIGTGKSVVRAILEKKGISTFDCDAIVRDLYEPDRPGAVRIKTFFGEDYLTPAGAVDRKKMLKILSKHAKKWELLNRMIHPLVATALIEKIKKSPATTIAVEIQIYNERIFHSTFDEIWIIASRKDFQVKRLKNRGLTSEQINILNKIQEQGARILHPKRIEISNNETLEGLKKKVEKLILFS